MRTLKTELNKSICNIGFLGAIILTFVLCFTTEAYRDSITDRAYTIFEIVLGNDNDLIANNYNLTQELLFVKVFSGYVVMFIPIITAFPFMVSFCAERDSTNIRLVIYRIGEAKYYLTKILSSIISGGLSFAVGVSLFGLSLTILFPSVRRYSVDNEILSQIIPAGITIKMILIAFFYGAVSTMPSLVISSFYRNRYIIISIPFIIVYTWNTALNKAVEKAVRENNYYLYDKLQPYFPNSITFILYEPDNMKCLIYNVAYICILSVAFYLIMKTRVDKGV